MAITVSCFITDEIFQLTEKATDRRPDPHIERRMEQMRRELLGEIQLLQSQLQISSAKGVMLISLTHS